MALGLTIGAIELGLYLFISHQLRKKWKQFGEIDALTYYWLTMTILTLIWECAFVLNYSTVIDDSQVLLHKEQHVWTNQYDFSYVLPWKLSTIFYSEYGAYADQEYMLRDNDWSRVIESTHALFCGLFAFLALHHKVKYKNNDKYLIMLSVSMGSQLMNSLLYMTNYFNELGYPSSVNYCSTEFPCGFALLQRPFMYVNIFWTCMPLYVIVKELKN